MSDTDEANLLDTMDGSNDDLNGDDEDDFEDCQENESKETSVNNGEGGGDQIVQKDFDYSVPVNRWKDYLRIEDVKPCLKEFFDRDEQSAIREDCRLLVEKLGNSESDQLSIISDLESIITTYAEETSCKYFSNNGWLEILQPLLALKVPRDDAYCMFKAIHQRYIPKCLIYQQSDEENSLKINDQPFHFLRLLLFYHDPELGSFLDTKKINPDSYALSWVSSKEKFAQVITNSVYIFSFEVSLPLTAMYKFYWLYGMSILKQQIHFLYFFSAWSC